MSAKELSVEFWAKEGSRIRLPGTMGNDDDSDLEMSPVGAELATPAEGPKPGGVIKTSPKRAARIALRVRARMNQ